MQGLNLRRFYPDLDLANRYFATQSIFLNRKINFDKLMDIIELNFCNNGTIYIIYTNNFKVFDLIRSSKKTEVGFCFSV